MVYKRRGGSRGGGGISGVATPPPNAHSPYSVLLYYLVCKCIDLHSNEPGIVVLAEQVVKPHSKQAVV